MHLVHGSVLTVFAVLVAIAAFFFVTTRLSIMVSSRFSIGEASSRHVYWIYRNPALIWLTDRQSVVSAVLLFQYHRLVESVLGVVSGVSLERGSILQVACVSGNLTEKAVTRCDRAARISVLDIAEAGIRNTEKKLRRVGLADRVSFFRDDATRMPFPTGSVDCAFSFFLFHELPMEKKKAAFNECLRVIRPGGTFVYAEFHRPAVAPLRMLAGMIFGTFEPYAREMWRWAPRIDGSRFEMTRRLFLFGYFQVVSVRKRTNPSE